MKKASDKKRRIWLIVLLSVVIFLFCVCISAVMVFKHYYGMLNIERDDPILDDQTVSVLEDEEPPYLPEESDTSEIPQDSDDIVDTEESIDIPNTEPSIDTGDETSSTPPSEDTAVQETTTIPNTQETTENLVDMKDNEETFRILLIGVDSKVDDLRGRSDTMILFDINPNTKKIIMTSLLRDIYVDIPGRGSDRINAAYAYGGAKLLTQTIAKSFGIQVDKYVIVNFGMVCDIVDALGGVEVDVTEEELKEINLNALVREHSGTDQLPESCVGIVRLNGRQALAYARIRRIDSDFARTGRQREIITASIEKLKQTDIFEINTLLNEILPQVTTNLTEKDILSLLAMAIKRKDYSIESMAIPVSGTWEYVTIDKKAVIKIDFAANAKAWYKKVSGE